MKNGANDLLIVVDMQHDFISGALGTPQAQAIVPRVVKRVKAHQGPVLFTRDTHQDDYLHSQEGRLLPVPHCIQGTQGWEIHPDLDELRTLAPVDKPAFGSLALAERVRTLMSHAPIGHITLVGLCTDICVISNALILKAAFPEIPVQVEAACCAGATTQGHDTALLALKACQVTIIEDDAHSQPD